MDFEEEPGAGLGVAARWAARSWGADGGWGRIRGAGDGAVVDGCLWAELFKPDG